METSKNELLDFWENKQRSVVSGMKQNKLYTAQLAGKAWDNGKKYEMVIITKWKSAAEDSPEEGHKAYYFSSNRTYLMTYLENCMKDEEWCRLIYETHPENQRLRIEIKATVYVENEKSSELNDKEYDYDR